MPRIYRGYTRTKARANLDALWQLLLLTKCGGDIPVLSVADPGAGRQYFGQTRFKANADVDAMWDALPGAIPADPATDNRIYLAYASTVKNADLDALTAAIAPFTCCAPPACVKILDEHFNFADRAAFLARWENFSSFIQGAHAANFDVLTDGETTQLVLIPGHGDQTLGNQYVTEFFSRVTPTPGAPVWMRVQAYLDLLPPSPYHVLDNAQQQIAFGGQVNPYASFGDYRQWYAFAVDTDIGGKFYTSAESAPPFLLHTNDPDWHYEHMGGLVDYPPDPGPGAGVMGFAIEPYYDGFATLWEMVAHAQFDAEGVCRIRTFIGPVDGPKVPMSDARLLMPNLETAALELTWLIHTHKNAGVNRAPRLKRVEAWECSYAANPCGVAIVVPDPTGPVASLEIVTGNISLDDVLEILEPIGVVAKDANGTIIPGVRPEFLVENPTPDTFMGTWGQGVSCGNPGEDFDVFAWYPNGGAGIESNRVHVVSMSSATDARRFWKLKLDEPDNGLGLSIAAISFHESNGGPDVSGGGTLFGSTPLGGTSLTNLLDGDPATYYTATGRPQLQEVGLDFGPGDDRILYSVKLTARLDRPDLAPAAFSIWSSADGVLWTRHQPYSRVIWSAGETREWKVID